MPKRIGYEIDEQLKKVGELCAERKAENYEELINRLIEARDRFHGMLAQRFTDAFNEHIASLPQDTATAKSLIARTANADLRAIGLTIRHPKTGGAAFLGCASTRPGGSFQICETADARYGYRMTSKLLPRLTLMPREVSGGPNSLGADTWANRMGSPRGAPKDRSS